MGVAATALGAAAAVASVRAIAAQAAAAVGDAAVAKRIGGWEAWVQGGLDGAAEAGSGWGLLGATDLEHLGLCVGVLHGERNKGPASPRTTKTTAQSKPPTKQPSHTQPANKQHYKPA